MVFVRRFISEFAPYVKMKPNFGRYGNKKLLSDMLKNGNFIELLPLKSAKFFKTLENTERFSVYAGFDPSAKSLQLGNLVVLIGLLRCHMSGRDVIAVVGEGTAMVGDPSGKSQKRAPRSSDFFRLNASGIETDLRRIIDNYVSHFADQSAFASFLPQIQILNNQEWLENMTCSFLLKELAPHFKITELMEKESVKLRLQSGTGMDLTEFLYPVLQAADFLHLHQNYRCRIQLGGLDQKGNVLCGLNLLQRKLKQYNFGLMVPLLTTPEGKKLGKTTDLPGEADPSSNFWLSPELLLPYMFYQKLINLPESYISAQLLRQLTFLSNEDIDVLLQEHKNHLELRIVHKRLAQEVTLLVHGDEALQAAELCTKIFFSNDIKVLQQLTSTERDFLLHCIKASTPFVPVLRFKRSASSTGTFCSLEQFEDILLLTGEPYKNRPDALRHIFSRGITLNDYVLMEPDVSLQGSDQQLQTTLNLNQLNDAFSRADPQMSLSIMKIGRRDYWFIINDK